MVETLHGKFLFLNAFFAVQNKEVAAILNSTICFDLH